MRRQTYSPRVGDKPVFWRTAALVVGGIMVAVLFAGYQPLVSAQTPINVAVLDYFVPSQYAVTGQSAARYAADDLARQLGHGHPNLAVIDRKKVRDAESSMGWKMPGDMGSFDRMAQLAQSVGADYLILGEIESVNLPGGGGGGATNATVRIEAFNASTKTITAAATGNGLAATTGGRDVAVQGALHNANAKALAALAAKLSSH
jgi:hypothetical protein